MYRDAMAKTWQFYEAQRSGGKRIAGDYPERPAWRGDSHLNDAVAGGWYDAGDTLKINFPLASSVSFLAWGLLEFQESYTVEQLGYAIADLRHVATYLLGCWDNTSKVYTGMIGDPQIDGTYCKWIMLAACW
jgi:endoglucanase